jgi:phenylalanyl-tRNA synthetase beta chain
MGISTDASYFFERGVDPEGIPFALKRFIHLAGGSAGAVGTVDGAHALGYTYSESHVAEKRKVNVSLSSIRAQMNLPRLEEVEIAARLKNLGYGIELLQEGKDKVFSLQVPSWRLWDVTSSDDVLEDVARSMSFSRVKAELPSLDYVTPEKNPVEIISERVRSSILGQGFVEVISKVFYTGEEASALETLSPKTKGHHVTIKNALEQGNSHLKITNAIHMGRIISANRKRGVLAPKIYEQCRVFAKPAELPSDEPRERAPLDYNLERDVLCFAAGGRWSDNDFRKGEPLEESVRSFIGAVSMVVRSLGAKPSISKSENPLFHPGIQGSVKAGRAIVGVIGVIHPTIQEMCDSKEPILYCELELEPLYRSISEPKAPAVSDLPAIRRDFTLQIPTNEQCAKIVRYLTEGSYAALEEVSIVDDFKRDGESFRRVTYRLKFQLVERTLQHEEVDKTVEGIISDLSSKHGIELAA